MAKLIYSTITSLDCFVEDSSGGFGWAEPDEEVFSFVNQLERPVGTYLYGRHMYETMVYWETALTQTDQSAVEKDFADIWKAADKIVYSTTLTTAASAKTRIERDFDPDVIAKLKESAQLDVCVGGSNLASQALKAGLVDEIQLFLTPILVGHGKRAFPIDTHLPLKLLEERRFGSGVIFLRFQRAD
ncbi:MAG: dihydrofolate reductase family protein [Acidimicrobiales bacterium]